MANKNNNTAHMLQCSLLSYHCILDDFLMFNDIGKECADNGREKFDDTMMIHNHYNFLFLNPALLPTYRTFFKVSLAVDDKPRCSLFLLKIKRYKYRTGKNGNTL